jgi:hypothetical protein
LKNHEPAAFGDAYTLLLQPTWLATKQASPARISSQIIITYKNLQYHAHGTIMEPT